MRRYEGRKKMKMKTSEMRQFLAGKSRERGQGETGRGGEGRGGRVDLRERAVLEEPFAVAPRCSRILFFCVFDYGMVMYWVDGCVYRRSYA
jgi:hypothetical protein